MLELLLKQHKKAELVQLTERIDSLSFKKSSSKTYLVDSLIELEIEDFTNILSPAEVQYYLSLLKIKPKKKNEENLAEFNHILTQGQTRNGKDVVFFDPATLKAEVKSIKTLFRSKDISLIKQAIGILDVLTPNYSSFYSYLEAFGYPLEEKDIFDRDLLTEVLFGKSIVRHHDQHSNVQYVGWWILGKLAAFPEFQEHQKKIKEFAVQRVEWDEFPETAINFTEITSVIFQANYSSFPEELFGFEKLEFLDLRVNKISKIPKEIKQFKNLKTVYLQSNQLKKLPDEIGEMESLVELICFSNQLEKLPETIGGLSRLERLNVSNNNLHSIPSTIIQLKTLQVLDISQNPIRQLPDKLDQLNLRRFVFDKDKIEILPDEFNLDDLYQKFNLSEFKSLQRLPAGLIKIHAEVSAWKRYQEKICELPKLRFLAIENTAFSRLLARYGSIQNMKYFGQTSTPEKLAELTANIGKLKSLEVLDISDNQFKFLPESIGELSSLIEFQAENCRLVALPQQLGDLKQLKILRLSNNRLREIGKEIGGLNSLQELYLKGNALLEIPNSIGDLKQLMILDLEDNALQKLPSFLRKMPDLEQLNLKDNPISEKEKDRIRLLLPNIKIEF